MAGITSLSAVSAAPTQSSPFGATPVGRPAAPPPHAQGGHGRRAPKSVSNAWMAASRLRYKPWEGEVCENQVVEGHRPSCWGNHPAVPGRARPCSRARPGLFRPFSSPPPRHNAAFRRTTPRRRPGPPRTWCRGMHRWPLPLVRPHPCRVGSNPPVGDGRRYRRGRVGPGRDG